MNFTKLFLLVTVGISQLCAQYVPPPIEASVAQMAAGTAGAPYYVSPRRLAGGGGPGIFSSVTDTGLTAGRVVFVSTGGLLADEAAFAYNSSTNTMTVDGIVGNTATAVTITGGSTGASLAIGQGTNGNVILTPKSDGLVNSAFFQVSGTISVTEDAQDENTYLQRNRYTLSHAGTNNNITWAQSGIIAEIEVANTNAHTYSNRQTGTYAYINHEGTGIMSLPICHYSVLAARGSGGFGDARAFDAHMFTQNVSGAGNVTSFTGLNIRAVTTAATTTVTSLIGMNMEDQVASGGTMGTVYGVKLGTLTAGATLVDGFANWGIYSPGVAPHYFGGPIGVGGGVNASQGLTVSNTVLTGVNQKGIVSNFTATTGSTTSVEAVAATFNTAASGGAYTVTNGVGYRLNSPGIGANTTVTTYRGFRIDNQGATGISNSYAVDILAQSGSASANVGFRNAASTVLTNATGATAAGAGALTVTGGIYTGERVVALTYVGGVESISGPGAANVTQQATEVTSTGVANAITLANGVAGQVKTVVHGVDGGSFVLDPDTSTGWSVFTSTVVGESITLMYFTTRGWVVIGSYLGVIAP